MVQRVEAKKSKQILHDVIFELQNVSESMLWFLSYDRLSELLEIRKEECLRKVYQFKSTKPQMTLSGGFHEVDGDLLIDFLAWSLELDEVAEEFLKGGIFFSERPLYELRESYKTLIQKTVANHKLDTELLLLLTAATVDYDDAVDSYLMDKFEIDFFVRRTIHQFLEKFEIHPEYGAEEFLYEYLKSLIPTKILNFRDITREFRDRTYYELYGRFRETKKKKKKVVKTVSTELKDLLAFFDLEPGASITDVKKKFKELLKKYHPDINKKGEEMTKRIILKYNRLVELIGN
ncbi:molecular chaperone DnaJ [Leptospira bandrabouensis]|uniref:molecular chaperone DnaJ n=1 Tax=Leptospira bandrabouensis TaxID=2484903 RepID=UPI001EE8D5A8|nr:molecular chaperone DnaJ [Leptospira bandrabouensis]MCG6143750.1 molecular chaperone DnaJ [Leptospira bandrabouensis]MCG6159410.1 molecular chaperone DnaJ [Leptospira bandrabouensis]MCG6163344.1 molecular chaperone DnaJ [Leptospira bandrabouensis]MCW7457264.1 molecular chaperone DnaJ [Leptospira bandrabouensis]MCW7476462.1 molecular chaperone DnaJ [Leptospira bandrabouensis]